MYRREVGRIKSGHCSRVPKLKESYICRDSWTRLNVQPSKIMQVYNKTLCHCTCMYMYMYKVIILFCVIISRMRYLPNYENMLVDNHCQVILPVLNW